MQNSIVSIIIPIYNGSGFLRETVESVMKQTCREWELLLVEDCSTDDSLAAARALAEEDSRIRVISQPANQGAAMARNRGIAEAKGRYIAFLDADDLWKPDKLRRELEFLKQKQAGFVFMGYEFADQSAAGTGKIVRVPETLNYRQALKNTTIFTSTVLFDTASIPKELIVMPDIPSEDTATWWKILRNGYIAYGLDENHVLYRRSANTLSSNKLEAVKRVWRLYREAEKLSLSYSCYNFIYYAVRAVIRRI